MRSNQHDDLMATWERELRSRGEVRFEPRLKTLAWFWVFAGLAAGIVILAILSGSPANWSNAYRIVMLGLLAIAAVVLNVAVRDSRHPRSLRITDQGIEVARLPVVPWAEVLHAVWVGKMSLPMVCIDVPTPRFAEALASVDRMEAIAMRLRFPEQPGRRRLLALKQPAASPDAIVAFILEERDVRVGSIAT